MDPFSQHGKQHFLASRSTSGHRCATSPCFASGLVSRIDLPPVAGIFQRPEVKTGTKIIVSSGAQLAPPK